MTNRVGNYSVLIGEDNENIYKIANDTAIYDSTSINLYTSNKRKIR